MASRNSAASIALGSCDLFLAITGFQDGMYRDMHPFRPLKKPSHNAYMDKTPKQVVSIDAALKPWLTLYGTSRLSKLFQQMPHMQDIVVLHAVIVGRVDLLQWFHACLPDRFWAFPDPLLDVAAAHGQLAALEYLHTIGHPGCTRNAMDWAAFHGHLHVVQFLHAYRSEGATTKAMDAAAMNGHLPVVEFLHASRAEGCTADAMTEAAWNGHLDVVSFLHTHRTEGCSVWTIDRAAWTGRLAVVRFLHEARGEKWTTQAMDMAAWNAHLNVLWYLHTRQGGAGCTANALNFAAMKGHMGVVRFLVEHRTEGDLRSAMNEAHQRRQTDIADYLAAKLDESK
ncbi:Aste57867_11364 [Aphanomyces stellatus]|uniref:Aste57867_11364 protein n=1 Tax=Aphanomyces stellatus TaxID=120398 RepID=A0A485KSS3_9STRA|nr:hypothetical protein As57867_011322 [Aphanomyces stellatus]VFT88226.1 Aste57867_11364 [Aphanomyces stellatus]